MMDVVDCYRVLGLRSGASFADIKASYRRLAQQYHPDINPNDHKAKEKFITLTEAYKLLLQVVSPNTTDTPQQSSHKAATPQQKPSNQTHSKPSNQTQQKPSNQTQSKPSNQAQQEPSTQTHPKPPTQTQQTATKQAPPQEKSQPKPPNLIEIERRLKWKTYEQLQRFIRERRFPQAIALAEALAERLPEDAEVRQWQAISYQVWGRALIAEKQWLKARIYLKKAMKTDPNNKSLLYEVERDFQKLEQIF